MTNPKVGDIVIRVSSHDGRGPEIGAVGEVVGKIKGNGNPPWAVFWRVPFNDGHDCKGLASDGHGWFVHEEEIELYMPSALFDTEELFG